MNGGGKPWQSLGKEPEYGSIAGKPCLTSQRPCLSSWFLAQDQAWVNISTQLWHTREVAEPRTAIPAYPNNGCKRGEEKEENVDKLVHLHCQTLPCMLHSSFAHFPPKYTKKTAKILRKKTHTNKNSKNIHTNPVISPCLHTIHFS